jgi:tungstate transport system ATP-binding protein
MNMASTVSLPGLDPSADKVSNGCVVSCRGLKRSLGAQVIVDIDRLSLERGRNYLLSGPNGAGKTTLLRILAGLERADCSEFRFDGRAIDLARYPDSMRRQIGFVHHHPLLFSSSVRANIAFGLHAAGVARAEVKRRTAAAIEWAGIGGVVERPPRALSAGEKQRVALARAHALDPALYLLDEPTANLDENGKELVTRLIDAIAAEGRTLLIACHDRDLLGLPGVIRLHMMNGRMERLR